MMDLDEIKTRINPLYAGCPGTESHERKWLCDRIDALLEALKACRDQFQHYVGHHLDKGDLDKAAQNERFVALAGAALASVEAPKNGD